MWICEVVNLTFNGMVALVIFADYIERKMKNKRRPPSDGKRR